MKIKGRRGEYVVRWASFGLTSAIAQVCVPETGIMRYLRGYRVIWQGDTKAYLTAQKAHPDELREWFQSAVNEYEDYIAAWEKEESA